MATITKYDDIIDVREIIERFEELESDALGDPDLMAEFDMLGALLADLRNAGGGDEKWRGDWYPITLIRDSYFKDYAQELAEDIGATNPQASWPHNCIDWDQAARELQMDYTTVEFDGTTYWTR